MIIQASQVRRWTEEDAGVYRDEIGRYLAKKKKVVTKPKKHIVDFIIEASLLWFVLLMVAIMAIGVMYKALSNLIDICVIS